MKQFVYIPVKQLTYHYKIYLVRKHQTTKSNIDCLRLDQLHTLKSIYTYSYNIYYRVNLSYVLFIIFKLQVNLWCFDYDIYYRVNLRFVLILIFKLQGELMVCFDYDIYYRVNFMVCLDYDFLLQGELMVCFNYNIYYRVNLFYILIIFF